MRIPIQRMKLDSDQRPILAGKSIQHMLWTHIRSFLAAWKEITGARVRILSTTEVEMALNSEKAECKVGSMGLIKTATAAEWKWSKRNKVNMTRGQTWLTRIHHPVLSWANKELTRGLDRAVASMFFRVSRTQATQRWMCHHWTTLS